jgi:hypothetical protein
MINLFSEIFTKVENGANKKDRVAVLQEYDTKALRQFFELLYDDDVEFDVEIPEYRPSIDPAGLNFTYLQGETPKLYRFIKGDSRSTMLTPKRKKQLMLMILEGLHKDESALLVGLLKKDIGIRHLTKSLVNDAFKLIDLKKEVL